MLKRRVLLNDKFTTMRKAKVSIEDRGYNFGDGVYEVVRFYNKKMFETKAHLQRLSQSCAEINIPYNLVDKDIEEKMNRLIKFSGYNSGYVYVQITRGVSKRNHLYEKEEMIPQLIAYAVQEEERPLELMGKGIKVLLTEDVRWLKCNVKSLNLLGNVLAKNQAAERGAKEAVLHRNGYITEGSSSNVFVIKDKVLYTHPANNLILNGITRKVVIEIANSAGYMVEEKPFDVEFFESADEAFTTSSTTEIIPIVEYEKGDKEELTVGQIKDGVRGPITRHLQKKFSTKITYR